VPIELGSQTLLGSAHAPQILRRNAELSFARRTNRHRRRHSDPLQHVQYSLRHNKSLDQFSSLLDTTGAFCQCRIFVA
jgi:hypothetical protein